MAANEEPRMSEECGGEKDHGGEETLRGTGAQVRSVFWLSRLDCDEPYVCLKNTAQEKNALNVHDVHLGISKEI
jgi:hypothetical protein